MMRLNLVLLLAVLATALYLVNTQYQSRLLFTALDRANAEAQKLALDTETLQVQKRTQATPGRVDQLARTRLQMRPASLAITQYVTYHAATASGRGDGPVPAKPMAQGSDTATSLSASTDPGAVSGAAAIKPVTRASR
ncbi:MAG: cell division protein FtsL [Rhodoferax sp.]